MKCPYCSAEVKIFGKGWQNQRSSKDKHCPECQGKVDLTFNGKKFAILLLPAIGFAIFSLPFLGNWSAGVAIFAALLPCAQLKEVT